MKIVVCGPAELCTALFQDVRNSSFTRVDSVADFMMEDADAFINLFEHTGEENYQEIAKPILVNAVSCSSKMAGWGKNIIRFNGWNSFIQRTKWEVSGDAPTVSQMMEALDKQFILLPDQPGFVSARVVSMIVNEAFFALEENISTEAEIDTAMKLGTNYPKGPFEWAAAIGIPNIHHLLTVLSATDKRYEPSALLTKYALQK